VIHAGYNLKPGSLKARLCVEGSRRLRAYCRDRGIPMFQGGILVVARLEHETATLAELLRRARANGVEAHLLSTAEMRDVEPAARGVQALHAPEGASFDAVAYVRSLLKDATAAGAQLQLSTAVRSISENRAGVTLDTTAGPLTARLVLNCAGLHADRLAGPLARDLRIIPFRGYYAELDPEARPLVRSHIYAAPDLDFPFLGVHLSRRADGRVTIGPGAMLAFGREAYSLLSANARDLAATLAWPGFYRMMAGPRFLHLAYDETLKSLSLARVWREARLLVPDLERRHLRRSFAGNRAQMVSRDGRLLDDILVRETARTVHVLNAVSPGLTGSIPFGEYLAEMCQKKL
jgi:L-2-hydroxyglutarate oxidase LhgO